MALDLLAEAAEAVLTAVIVCCGIVLAILAIAELGIAAVLEGLGVVIRALLRAVATAARLPAFASNEGAGGGASPADQDSGRVSGTTQVATAAPSLATAAPTAASGTGASASG